MSDSVWSEFYGMVGPIAMAGFAYAYGTFGPDAIDLALSYETKDYSVLPPEEYRADKDAIARLVRQWQSKASASSLVLEE